MIKQYFNFLNESEKTDNKAILLLSNKFVEIITKILNNKITETFLKESKSTSQNYTATAIDIDDDGSVSYINANKFNLLLSRDDDDFFKKYRQKITIGRLIVKLFGNKFTQSEIEKFNNEFKALISHETKIFEIVKGEDIRKYYLYDNYAEDKGTLGNSCMKHNRTQKYLDIYVENEKISMIILKRKGQDKIIGRALLWEIDNLDRPFMDRIYSSEQFDINTFKNFAKKNGFYYKKEQCFNCNDVEFNDESKGYILMKIKLKEKDYKYYPFLDTMFYYSNITGEISNKKDIFKENQDLEFFLELKYSEGDYEKIYNFYFDKYNNVKIDAQNAIHCLVEDAYCHKKDAVMVQYGRHTFFAFPNHVVECKNQGIHILKEDAVWSEKNKDYFWKLYYDVKTEKPLKSTDLIGRKIRIKGNSNVLMKGNWNNEMENYLGQEFTVTDYMAKSLMMGSIYIDNYYWYSNCVELID